MKEFFLHTLVKGQKHFVAAHAENGAVEISPDVHTALAHELPEAQRHADRLNALGLHYFIEHRPAPPAALKPQPPTKK
jgi:hypothetical protein